MRSHSSSLNQNDKNFASLEPTLDFLSRCNHAAYDWTSAVSISEPPEGVTSAIANSFKNFNQHKATPSQGEPRLLEAASDYFNRCGIPCTPQNVCVANTSFDIIADIYRYIIPQSLVLIPTPTFGYYVEQCSNDHMRTALLPASEQHGWKILPEELDRALTETKASIFLFTNPTNPTGVAYNENEVSALANVLKKHEHVLVISDEVFKDISLDDNHKPHSIAAIDGMADRTITLNGVGKSRGLHDLHVSFCCAPESIVRRLTQVHKMGFPRPTQIAAVQSLLDNEENNTYLRNNETLYHEHINVVKEQVFLLNEQLNTHFRKEQSYIKPVIDTPQATNLYLLSFEGLKGKFYNKKPLSTGLDVARFLLQEARVAMVPGDGFFMEPESMVVRLCVGYPKEQLIEGFQAIGRACSKLVDPPAHYPVRSSGSISSQL